MITEKDIQDWVHTDTNLSEDSYFDGAEDDNPYPATTTYFEIFQKVVNNLLKINPYNLQGKY